jgi:excisionase family DNA binding protein
MPPIFVDAHGLAQRLDVEYDTILTWVRRGKLPYIRDGRGRLLFNLNQVVEALREKPIGTCHEAADRGGDDVS